MDAGFLDNEITLKLWMLISAPVALCALSCCFCRCINKA